MFKRIHPFTSVTRKIKPVIEYRAAAVGFRGTADSPNASLVDVGIVAETVDSRVWGGQTFTTTLDLTQKSKITIPAHKSLTGMQKFTVEVLIKPATNQASTMTIVALPSTPFRLALRKGNDPSFWRVDADVKVRFLQFDKEYTNWCSAGTTGVVKSNEWSAVSAVWDGDSLLVLVNGRVVDRRCFRDARLVAQPDHDTGRLLGIGSGPNGIHPFVGGLAGLRIYDTVPTSGSLGKAVKLAIAGGFGAIDSLYQDARGDKGKLGAPTSAEERVGSGRRRRYENGMITWHPETGAVLLEGSIASSASDPRAAKALGFPISDPVEAMGVTVANFQNGAIYQRGSNQTGAVWGPAYLRYLTMTKTLGLPMGKPMGSAVNPDAEFVFERGRIFQSPDTGAFEVHGLILDRYRSLGGRSGQLGMPVSDEQDVCDNNRVAIGRMNRFEHGAIYFKSGVGAWEVRGEMLRAYAGLGGPASSLGFPTSNEQSVPGTDICFNDFEHGVMVWRPGWESAKAIQDLEFKLVNVWQEGDIIDSKPEGIDSDAELYVRVWAKVDGNDLASGDQFPTREKDGASRVEIEKTWKFPVKSTTTLWFRIDFWDYDRRSDDDRLGRLERTFDIRTLWGTDHVEPNLQAEVGLHEAVPLTYRLQNSSGTYDVPAGGLGNIRTNFRIGIPAQKVDWNLFRKQAWWSFGNYPSFRVENLTMGQYVQAFSDVDYVSKDNAWAVLMNPWDKFWYEVAFKGAARKGSCYGFSREAFRSLLGFGLFPEHIYRFSESNAKNAIHIGQGSQFSGEMLGWVVRNLLNLNLIQPQDVFREAQKEINGRGACMISVMDLDEMTGHTVLAYKALSGGASDDVYGTLLVADPNLPWVDGSPKTTGHPSVIEILTDNSFRSTFGYSSKSIDLGILTLPSTLMMAVPWRVAGPMPHTPFLEIFAAILALGGLIVFAGDALVEQVSSGNKDLLNGSGPKREFRRGLGIVPVPVLDAESDTPLILASSDRLNGRIRTDFKGARDGQYRMRSLSGPCMVGVDAPIIVGARDSIELTKQSPTTMSVSVSTTQPQKTVDVHLGVALDPAGRPPRSYRIPLGVSAGDSGIVGIEPSGGALLISSGGPDFVGDIEVSAFVDGEVRTGKLRGVAIAGGDSALRIAPVNWRDPQGDFSMDVVSIGTGATRSSKTIRAHSE